MIVLSRYTIAEILNVKSGTAQSSMDLGITGCSVQVTDGNTKFPDGTVVDNKTLQKIAKSDRGCFEIIDGEAISIQQFSETTGYLRSLAATKGAPTMLVSGIPMHRIKDTDPMEDTKNKIEALGPIHGKVLDTATGLGYTAIMAAKRADQVVTVEIDPVGIEIAKRSPWSKELFDNPKIQIIIGDIDEVIETFPAGEFSAIIHDPPTFQFAGELYSLEFYEKLFYVLSRKGTLFHYIADPDSKLGERMTKGVMKRLHEAGFQKVERRPKAFGVIAKNS
jgi:predicted methyltransferase